MNELFGRSLMSWGPDRWLRAGTEIEAPIVDMYYDKEELVISAELPGMEKDDVEVNVNNHLLTLKGNKKRQETIAEDDYLCRERAYGRFSRSLELPADVQGEKVRASFKNGVLEIRLPCTGAGKGKTIKVEVT